MKKLVSLTRAFTFGMAALSIPGLALAQATFVELGNTGQMIGDGEAVAIRVTVACTDDTENSRFYPSRLFVGVSQHLSGSGHGAEYARGYDHQEIGDCYSTRKTVQVVVTAGTSLTPGGPRDPNQRFRRGSANANASLSAYYIGDDGRDRNQVTDSETIEIGNFGRQDPGPTK